MSAREIECSGRGIRVAWGIVSESFGTAVPGAVERTNEPRIIPSCSKPYSFPQQQIRRQLAIGVARNETIDRMTERLRKMGGPRSIDSASGLFSRFRYQAERLVRTEVMNAYNEVHHAGLELAKAQEPGIQKRWDATRDLRRCKICRGLHGKIAELDQLFDGKYRSAPAHPNCRCVIVAWHVDWPHDRLSLEI